MTLKRGDFVWLTCGERTVEAMVLLRSMNGRSLMLGFDAMLDGHLGMMPVLQGEDGVYRALVTQKVIEIKERPRADQVH
jgi:hypothetical protein